MWLLCTEKVQAHPLFLFGNINIEATRRILVPFTFSRNAWRPEDHLREYAENYVSLPLLKRNGVSSTYGTQVSAILLSFSLNFSSKIPPTLFINSKSRFSFWQVTFFVLAVHFSTSVIGTTSLVCNQSSVRGGSQPRNLGRQTLLGVNSLCKKHIKLLMSLYYSESLLINTSCSGSCLLKQFMGWNRRKTIFPILNLPLIRAGWCVTTPWVAAGWATGYPNIDFWKQFGPFWKMFENHWFNKNITHSK